MESSLSQAQTELQAKSKELAELRLGLQQVSEESATLKQVGNHGGINSDPVHICEESDGDHVAWNVLAIYRAWRVLSRPVRPR